MDELILCKYCQKQKIFSEFNKCNYTKNELQQKCRKCEKDYRIKNKLKIKERSKIYRSKNPTKSGKYRKEYYLKNKDKISLRIKKWTENNKERIKNVRKMRYIKNKVACSEYSKQYRLKNIEKYREYQKEYAKRKRAEDLHYKIQHRLRNRILVALKRSKNIKLFRLEELMGCNILEIRNHIQNKFKENMTWEKFMAREIVIDHIRPCCSFDLKNPKEQKKCFHFSNLQPLWKLENLNKISQDLEMKNYILGYLKVFNSKSTEAT